MNDLTARVAASMATRRDTAMTAVVVLTSFHHDGYDMRRIFVLPTSWAGWGLFIAFVALVLAGIWPVIGWVNRATLVMGLPLLVVWSYVIILSCVAVMLVGNRIVERDDHE
ncbi:MAG: hypothetical protein VYB92_00920 [Pseudomonadota bacterium]|nr:hypothetical protein [Pseudomonadota bacterium]